jgi:hypothetical protein
MAAIAISSSMILVIINNTIMGLTKMIEHVLVCVLGSMDATAHNAKHDKKKYEAGTKRGMNWTCHVNKLFLDQ